MLGTVFKLCPNIRDGSHLYSSERSNGQSIIELQASVELIQPPLVHRNILAEQMPKHGEKEPGFANNLDVYTFCVQREIIKRVACMHGQVNRALHVPQEVEHKELTLLHQAVLVKFVPQQRLLQTTEYLPHPISSLLSVQSLKPSHCQ